MAFGPSTYLKNGYHAEVAWGWYYNSSNQVVILWDSVVQYEGSIYLYNPYRDFTDGDAFPGNDGNNYAIGDPQTADNETYTYTTLTYSTSTYSAGYEYYGVRQEVVNSIIPPDTSIIVESNTPLFSSSSFDVRLTATTSSTTYEIRSSSYSGTILKTITNQNNVWVTVNNQPSTSGTTYYITAFVSTANGGDGTRSNVTTFTVTRNSEVNPDTAITQSPSGDITTSNSTFTKSITNANSNNVTDYRLLRTTGTDTEYDTYTGTATSFTLTGDMPSSGSWTYVIQARVPTANNGDNVWVNAGSSFTVTRSSSGGSSGGTTYNEYGSTTDITRNIFNDDLINLYYNVQGADTNKSWFISDVGCNATPGAGFFFSGHPTGSVFMSYLNSFTGSSYSAEFFVDDTSKFTISGTVTDPYGVTNINFSSKTVTPGNGTTTTESVAQTFDTFREGETLDYSVTGGELYNGSAWGTSGTVTDGASIKLRGITPSIYGGSKTVTVTFSKNSATKRTESFVINTPSLTAPTDIQFVNDGDSSATEQVTVTASGGTSGTIKVSNDGTNWYANGTKFNHTRGTGVTYYARREGVNSLTSSNYTEAHAVSCITPTNLTFVNDGDASATEDVTVTASGGYGGTLEVSSDGSTWHANGTKFDQSRNTSVTYYARRKATYSSGNYTESHSVGYLAPLAYSYTVSGSNPLNYSDAGFNVAISGADANHTYRVLHDGADAGTRTTDGNIAVQFSELPLPGGQKTYTVQAVRAASTGGSGTYVTKSTFVRSVRPSTPSVSSSVSSTESSTTNVTVSASSTGATEYRFSNDGTNYTDWGTSSSHVFENQSRGTAYTYYVQSRSAIVESLVGSSTITVPYLAPKAFSYSVSDSDPLAYNDSGFNVTLSGTDANHVYSVFYGSTPAGLRTDNGDILISGSELPSAGGRVTYTVKAARSTTTGGSGSYVNISTFNRSMRPSDPTISIDTADTAAGTADVTVTSFSVGATEFRFSKDGGSTYTAWQTSGSYVFEDLNRGTGYTFKVQSRSTYAYSASDASQYYTVPYLAPQGFSYSVSDSDPLAYGDGGFNVTIAGADADHSYRVLHNGSVAGFRTDNGDILISGSELPSAGGRVTYTVQALRYTQIGGSGSYVSINTFTRSMRPSNPTISASTANTESNLTNVTVTGASIGATEYRFSKDNGATYTSWQSSYSYEFTSLTRGSSYNFKVETRSSYATAASAGSLSYSVPYLAPKLYSYSVSDTNPLSYGDTGFYVTISNADANHVYSVLYGGSSAGTLTTNGDILISGSELPSAGGIVTYSVQAARATSIGGSGSYVTTATFTKSMRPSVPSISASTASTASGTADVTVTGASIGATEYRFSKDNGGTYTAWQTSGSYVFEDLNRGTEYDFKLEARSANATAASAASLSYPVPYLAPQAFSYSVSDPDPLAYNDAGFNVTIAGADADHSYRVLHDGNVAGFRTTNGDILISGSELPSAGGRVTYTVQALRYTQIGGSGSYVNISTFTRSMRPSNPTISASTATTESNLTSVTVTGASIGATEYRFSKDNGATYTSWQSSYSYEFASLSRGSTYNFKVETRSAYATAATAGSLSYPVPYLAPKLYSYSVSDTNPLSYGDTGFYVTISNADANHTYRVLYDGTSAGTLTTNGDILISGNELPSAGGIVTYSVQVVRATSIGGSGSYVTTATFNKSMRPSVPIRVTSGFGIEASPTASHYISASSVGATQYRFKVSPSDSNSGVFSAWQSSGTFTFDTTSYGVTRGDSITTVVEARSTNATAASALSHASTVTYLNPDLGLAGTSSTINRGDTTATSTLSSATSGDSYVVRANNGSTDLSNVLTDNGTFTISSGLPAIGSSTTYEIFAKKPIADGGSNTYIGSNDTFTVTRYGNPTVDTFGTSNATPNSGQQYTISGTFSDPQSETVSWSLERKTGTTGTYSQISSGTGAMSVNQSLAVAADTTYYYRVKISALDSDTVTSSEVSVTVSEADLTTVDITSVGDITPDENTSDQVEATTTTNSGVTISSYSWTKTGSLSISNTAVQNPTITFGNVTANSAASLTVTVTDSLGRIAKDTQDYTIQFINQGPLATLSGTQAVLQNEEVNLTAAGSYDPDGFALEYKFSTTNGTEIFTQAYSASETFDFTPTETGVYTTTVTVKDTSDATATALFSTIVSEAQDPNAGSGGGYGFEVYNAAGDTVIRSDELIIRKVTTVVLDTEGAGSAEVALPDLGTQLIASGLSEAQTDGGINYSVSVENSTATVTIAASGYISVDLYMVK